MSPEFRLAERRAKNLVYVYYAVILNRFFPILVMLSFNMDPTHVDMEISKYISSATTACFIYTGVSYLDRGVFKKNLGDCRKAILFHISFYPLLLTASILYCAICGIPLFQFIHQHFYNGWLPTALSLSIEGTMFYIIWDYTRKLETLLLQRRYYRQQRQLVLLEPPPPPGGLRPQA